MLLTSRNLFHETVIIKINNATNDVTNAHIAISYPSHLQQSIPRLYEVQSTNNPRRTSALPSSLAACLPHTNEQPLAIPMKPVKIYRR